MPSLLAGYEYDIFISYRQNDNRSGWVTDFMKALQQELSATIKEPLSIYYDQNPHDGLLDTDDVGRSLESKLNCLIFIPILSKTYCDEKSFAWNYEFRVFCLLSKEDSIGSEVKLLNGNVSGRILPIQIHDLDTSDQMQFEKFSGKQLRSIDFTFSSLGVNRPLSPEDSRADNQKKTLYRDQINKTANTIKLIIESIQSRTDAAVAAAPVREIESSASKNFVGLWKEITRRNVVRAALVYIILALFIHQLFIILVPFLKLEERFMDSISWILIIGFVLSTSLAWLFEIGPYGLIRTNSKQSFDNPLPPHKKKPLTSTPLVAILLVILVAQYIYFTYAKTPIERLSLRNTSEIITIAVLPFENRSGNEVDKYIAVGITDDIINRLTNISGLKVASRRKIKLYEGQVLPFNDIARELDVQVILAGSVERQSEQIAVRAQLIDAEGTFIWGNTLHRTSANMMAIESEIAQIITSQLKLHLTESEKIRLEHPHTLDATAYDFYLRGRNQYYKYEPLANDSAIEQFKSAINIDPNYALAWAGLGDAYSQMNMRFGRSQSWLDSSMMAGARAIQLDSTLSEGYKALANAYSYKKLYDKAFPLLKRAVELNPTNDQAIGNLGTNYLLRGDLAKALYWEKKGVGMDPKNWIPYQLTGWIYRLLGDLGNAESWLLKSLELKRDQFDTYELLCYTYMAQGRKNEALKLVPKLLDIDNTPRALEIAGLISHYAGDAKSAKRYFMQSIEENPDYKSDPNIVSPLGLGQILLEEGQKVDADVYLSHAMTMNVDQIEQGSQSYEPSFYISAIYAIRGNKDQSLKWLQKAYDLNWIDYAHILHGPYFAKLNSDPGIAKLVSAARSKAEAMRKEADQY